MQNTTRTAELERISHSLSERLRRVCAYMSVVDFEDLVRKMAEVQWRSEHRQAELRTAELMDFGRDPRAR